MIYFLQPFDFGLNIGRAYNEQVEMLPKDCWVCITDQDTLKFHGFADRVKQIIEVADKTQVITCKTNRLRKDNDNVIKLMYNEPSINEHIEMYHILWNKHKTALERTKMPIAGVCMIFHKSVWERVPFRERAINFDQVWSVECRNAGFTTHVAKGLYIFHLYRWERGEGDVSHLFKK